MLLALLFAITLGPSTDLYGPYATDVVSENGPPLATVAIGARRFVAWSEAGHLYLAPLRNGVDRQRRVEITRPGDYPGLIASTALATDGSTILAAWVAVRDKTAVVLARRLTLDLEPIDQAAMYLETQESDAWALAASWNGSEYIVAWGDGIAWVGSRSGYRTDAIGRQDYTTHATAAASAKSGSALAMQWDRHRNFCFGIMFPQCWEVDPELRLTVVDRNHVARAVSGFDGRNRPVGEAIGAGAVEDRFLAAWKTNGSLVAAAVSADGFASLARPVGLLTTQFRGKIEIEGGPIEGTVEWLVAWEEQPAPISRQLRIIPLAADGSSPGSDAMITIEGGASPSIDRAGDGAYYLTYAAQSENGWTIRTQFLTTKTPPRPRASR